MTKGVMAAMAAMVDARSGSFVSLVTQIGLRYQGYIVPVEFPEFTVALMHAQCFGTEGRRMDGFHVPPKPDIYPSVIFRGSEITELHFLSLPPAQSIKYRYVLAYIEPASQPAQQQYYGGNASFAAGPSNIAEQHHPPSLQPIGTGPTTAYPLAMHSAAGPSNFAEQHHPPSLQPIGTDPTTAYPLTMHSVSGQSANTPQSGGYYPLIPSVQHNARDASSTMAIDSGLIAAPSMATAHDNAVQAPNVTYFMGTPMQHNAQVSRGKEVMDYGLNMETSNYLQGTNNAENTIGGSSSSSEPLPLWYNDEAEEENWEISANTASNSVLDDVVSAALAGLNISSAVSAHDNAPQVPANEEDSSILGPGEPPRPPKKFHLVSSVVSSQKSTKKVPRKSLLGKYSFGQDYSQPRASWDVYSGVKTIEAASGSASQPSLVAKDRKEWFPSAARTKTHEGRWQEERGAVVSEGSSARGRGSDWYGRGRGKQVWAPVAPGR